MTTPTFVRFTVDEVHPDSERPVGVLHAYGYLFDDGLLLEHERERYEEIGRWFGKNLPVPPRFARSQKSSAASRALSWFKSTAKEHIRIMREIASVLEEHDIRVTVRTTTRPGYVVYEDEFQIVAEPFTDSGA
ncbi:MAG: hypothetical protein AAGD14_10495 [Planctomycetota bacterium]